MTTATLDQISAAQDEMARLKAKQDELQKVIKESNNAAIKEFASQVAENLKTYGWSYKDFHDKLHGMFSTASRNITRYTDGEKTFTLQGRLPKWLQTRADAEGISDRASTVAWVKENFRVAT